MVFPANKNFIFSLYFFKLLPPTGQDIFCLHTHQRGQKTAIAAIKPWQLFRPTH
ncbi:hypothetical protein SAMN02745133_02076 [Desulforamulus putei DSM 12395]|uniref:Uncharacterized protein n=1 Tax=Desulforamulus putei DSM 12395 TaxID=1121429 RepID=A0A1M4ZRD7_9FIRM|nr:hypothetical protein SAMN02745133_02076 [Desulforamulus putei DSM 12395]